MHAIVAIEDQRFYEHGGFDLVRIASAALANIRHGRRGAGRQHDHAAARAAELPHAGQDDPPQAAGADPRARGSSAMYTKPQILELYLNKVYFGDGLYGVEAASRGYFGKHASELTVPEAALLAGPREVAVELRADRQPRARASRAATSCCRRCSTTARSIAPTWQAARAAKVALHDGLRAEEPHGQYFKEQVRRELVERFGWQRVYQGGLRVFTTIDMPMQIAAEAAVADSLKSLDAAARRRWRRAARRRARGAGRRRRAAPGRAGRDGSRHRPRARDGRRPRLRREPASTAPCRRSGSPARRSSRSSTPPRSRPATRRRPMIDHLNDPIDTLQGAWTPEDEHSTAESMTLRTGLRTSSNRAAVRLLQEVGIPDDRAVREEHGRRRRAERAVARARLRRGHAAVDDGGVRGVREPRPRAAADPHPPRRGSRRHACSTRPHESSTRAISDTTAFLMSTHAGRRDQRGHGDAGARSSASRCRPPARPARPTTSTTRGSSASRRSSSPASGSASISRTRFCRTASPPTSPCRSGRSS